jgi:hypothetical protein
MDYETWKEQALTKCQQNVDNMTEEKWELLAQIRQLIRDGNIDEAKQLAKDNDLKMPGMGNKFGNFKNKENFQAIKAAIEAGDFNAWLEAVGDSPLAEIITAENFDQFIQMHNLRQAGDIEAAQAIAEELGLPEPKQKHGGFGKMPGKKFGNLDNREDMKAALDANDYNAWLEAVGDGPLAEIINQENFSQLVEMHNLLEAGDKDGAKAIAEELGLPHFGQKQGPKFGNGWNRPNFPGNGPLDNPASE